MQFIGTINPLFSTLLCFFLLKKEDVLLLSPQQFLVSFFVGYFYDDGSGFFVEDLVEETRGLVFAEGLEMFFDVIIIDGEALNDEESILHILADEGVVQP